jgi:AAA+ superfamily predicted ATPase
MTQPAPVPGHFAPWAKSLAEAYFSGTTCMFVLSGNVHDLQAAQAEGEATRYLNLSEYLAEEVFGSWDLVIQFDLGIGLKARAGADPKRLQAMMQYLSARWGEPGGWPRDPDGALLAIDRLLERNLMESDPQQTRSIAIVLGYAQHLVPASDLGAMSRGAGTNLVRLLGWAQNPYFKRVNTAVCLIADKLAEVNDRLVQNPHVTTIAVPMPDTAAREAFITHTVGASKDKPVAGISAPEFAAASNGLSLISLNVVLSQARPATGSPPDGGGRFDTTKLKALKKAMIERQCQGLLEFVEPGHTLDLVVGQDAAKKRLREDADLLLRGVLSAAPMGYLISGPVGTGKTFMAECYAGSIGIPCVKLRNFRSKYVGETEGNLEQVLTVLRSLGPVVVMIDEADAALGNRSADGDSGTSSRIFSMIASQMGDTRYRGLIVWMLLTCRPDLLPIDLKRQGRAEVHIPLFYPQSDEEAGQMLTVMARKNKVRLADGAVPVGLVERKLSGADIESVVLAARRRALAAGREEVTTTDVHDALNDFIPSVQGLEKELQEIAAVLECTQLSFLPPEWQDRVKHPNGRTMLQERLVSIKRLIEE